MTTYYNFLIDISSNGEHLADLLEKEGFVNLSGKPLEVQKYCPLFPNGNRVSSFLCTTEDFLATEEKIKVLVKMHHPNAKIHVGFISSRPNRKAVYCVVKLMDINSFLDKKLQDSF